MLDREKFTSLLLAFLTVTSSQEYYDNTKVKQFNQGAHTVSNENHEAIAPKIIPNYRQPLLLRLSHPESTRFFDVGEISKKKQFPQSRPVEIFKGKVMNPDILDLVRSKHKNRQPVTKHDPEDQVHHYYTVTQKYYDDNVKTNSRQVDGASNESVEKKTTYPIKYVGESVPKFKTVGYYVSNHRTPTGHNGAASDKHKFVPVDIEISTTKSRNKQKRSSLAVDLHHDLLQILSSKSGDLVKFSDQKSEPQLYRQKIPSFMVNENHGLVEIKFPMSDGRIKSTRMRIHPVYGPKKQFNDDNYPPHPSHQNLPPKQRHQKLTPEDSIYLAEPPIQPKYGRIKTSSTIGDNSYASHEIESRTTANKMYYSRPSTHPNRQKYSPSIPDDYRYDQPVIRSSKRPIPLMYGPKKTTKRQFHDAEAIKPDKTRDDFDYADPPIQSQYDELKSTLTVDDNRYYSLVVKPSKTDNQLHKKPTQPEHEQLKSTLTVDDDRYYSLIVRSSTADSQLAEQPTQPEYEELKSKLTVDDDHYYSLIVKSSTSDSQLAEQPTQPEYEQLKSTLTVDDNQYYSLIVKSSTTDRQLARQPAQPEHELLKSTLTVDDNQYYSLIVKSSTTDNPLNKQPAVPDYEQLKSTLTVDDNRYYSLVVKSSTTGSPLAKKPTQPARQPTQFDYEKLKSTLTVDDNRYYSLVVKSPTTESHLAKQPTQLATQFTEPKYEQLRSTLTVDDNRYYSLFTKSSTSDSQLKPMRQLVDKQSIPPQEEQLQSTLVVDNNRYYSLIFKNSPSPDVGTKVNKLPIQPLHETEKSSSLDIKSTATDGPQPIQDKSSSIINDYSLVITPSSAIVTTELTQQTIEPVNEQEKITSTIDGNLAMKLLKTGGRIDCNKCVKKKCPPECYKPPTTCQEKKTTKACPLGIKFSTFKCLINCATTCKEKKSCKDKSTTPCEVESTTYDGTWYDFLGVTSQHQNRSLSPDMIEMIKDQDASGDMKDCMIDFIDCLCARNMEHIDMYRLCAMSYRTGEKRSFNSICELHYENCKRNDNWIYEGDIDCDFSNPQKPLDFPGIDDVTHLRRSLCVSRKRWVHFFKRDGTVKQRKTTVTMRI